MTEAPTLGIFRLNPEVQIPELATDGSACFDIRAYLVDGDVITGYNRNNVKFSTTVINGRIAIKAGDRLMIPTGLVFDIPEGYSVRFHPRSGAALKQGFVLANMEGVVDSDYVEQSMILLWNTTDEYQNVSNGERVCQAELVKNQPTRIVEIDTKPEQKTTRVGGFGSTGNGVA